MESDDSLSGERLALGALAEEFVPERVVIERVAFVCGPAFPTDSENVSHLHPTAGCQIEVDRSTASSL